tara:strand:- start:97 stop:300 length:204 start_codon:yes stop_codon:yes gene_type:complete
MATQIKDYHQTDLEEAIMQVNARDFDEKFHMIENDEETTLFLLHECCDDNLHHLEAEIHHQIDPSYQ